jgi:hypothetical protein
MEDPLPILTVKRKDSDSNDAESPETMIKEGSGNDDEE